MDTKRTATPRGQALIRQLNTVLLSCTAIAILIPSMSLAQDTATSDGLTVLQTITVQGQGGDDDSKSIVATRSTGVGKMPAPILETPATVSVVTSKEIQERGADSIEKVVQYTAGVTTDYYGSDDRYDYFTIRGFTPFTYRDGMVVGRTWSGIREEPYAFERIEILKGANSTGFGVSDPGGAVNYVTKTPKSERFGEVYTTGGSFAHKEVGIDFGDNITEDDTLSYRLTGKFQRSNAEYDYSQDDENFIMGGLTWRPTDATSLTFVFDHLDKDGTPSNGGHPIGTDLDRDSFFGEPDYNFDATNRNTYSVLFNHDFGSGLSFSSNARYTKADTGFGYAYIYDSTPTNLVDRSYFGGDKSSEQFIVDAHMLYETNFNDDIESRTLFGLEYNKFESENVSFYAPTPPFDWTGPVYAGSPGSLAPYSGANTDQKTKAVYLQQDLTFFDKLTASIGLRNDWMDLSEDGFDGRRGDYVEEGKYSEFSKRFGLSYKWTPEVATYVSYAESVAPPSAGTEPTLGKQYEVGIKYQPEAFPALFTASIYDLTMKNITTYQAPVYLPETVDQIHHRGLDLEAKAEITDNINLIAAYSYIDSEIEENGNASGADGKRFQQVPKHLASIWGTYTFEGEGARGDMTFGVGARYIGSYFFSNANTLKSDGAVVFDAAYTYKIQENTTFQVNVSNVFDEKHVANSDGGALYYNPGRAFYASLRQTW